MTANLPQRTTRELSAEEMTRLQQQRAAIANERPDLITSDQRRKEAQDEPTMSGEFRRAIHRSGIPITQIATQAGITPLMLDEFLTGERTLRSDVLDRLAQVLNLHFQSTI